MHRLSQGLLFSAGLIFLGLGITGCENRKAAGKIPVPDIVLWSAPQTDIVELLSIEPNECLPEYETVKDAQLIAQGRLAFRSPFLLGGQAARRGLTCQACHGQGQTNTHFFITSLSSQPGTADVTSFHFSDVLGDESFNPVPIPSLSDDVEGVDFSPLTDDLDIFMTRLITKEFTGPEPSIEIKQALLTYLRALDDKYCQNPMLSGAELMDYKISTISESFSALLIEDQTQATLNFMTAALRIEIGRLHERFPNHPSVQDDLAAISQQLNAQGGDVDIGAVRTGLDQWDVLSARLSQYYGTSLFNPAAIKTWDSARR